MKSAFGYRADILGLFWLATALFLSLSLGSYHPYDPSFNTWVSAEEVKNYCGYFGSFLSDLMYQLFGGAAWVFVLVALRHSLMAFKRNLLVTNYWQGLIWFFGAVVVSSALAELHFPKKYFLAGEISAGGAIGHKLVEVASYYLDFAGLFIVLWCLTLMLVVLYTRSSVVTTLYSVLQTAKWLLIKIWTLNVKGMKWLAGKVALREWMKSVLKKKSAKAYVAKKTEEAKQSEEGFSFPFSSGREEEKPEKENKKSSLFHYPIKGDHKEAQDKGVMYEKKPPSGSSSSFKWKFPPLKLLTSPPPLEGGNDERDRRADALRLKQKLKQFAISGEITNVHSGPVITLYEFKPDDHIKVARISQMEDDLMIALKSQSIRIIAPIPGKDVVGIEAAKPHRNIVYLKDLLKETAFWKNTLLPVVLGRQVDGRPAIVDLAGIPHLMVAGSTGSGKSVFVVSFLVSLLFKHSPDTLRMLLVDPKRVDLSVFEGLPHLLTPPVMESAKAVKALQWCLMEMKKRYLSLAKFQVRDLKAFNEKVKKLKVNEIRAYQEHMQNLPSSRPEESYYFSPQPYICIVLEEFGDLMSSPEKIKVENAVVRLAQMARACGMHLVLSMQSPRKDVVTGLIKTNISGRISFKVSSQVDSRIILDEAGAERLLSVGDMLYLGPGKSRAARYHGPFIKEQEVKQVVDFWKNQKLIKNPQLENGVSFSKRKVVSEEKDLDLTFKNHFETQGDVEDGEKYVEICKYVTALKEVSVSLLQRRYGLGYPKAARLIDKMEEKGLVGPPRGSKPREVLVQK